MNALQDQWAAKHDWYITSTITPEGHLGAVVRADIGEGTIVFTNYVELRQWAGY